MKKKIMAGAVLLLAASIFIGGCGIKSVSTDTGAGYTVTDATGREVKIPKKPERIMGNSASIDTMLLGVVTPDKLIAATEADRDPAISYIANDTKNIKMTVPLMGLSMELVTEAKPDLIIASTYTKGEQLDLYRNMGIPVVVIKGPRSIEEVESDIRIIAAATGEKERGEKVVAKMDEMLTESDKRLSEEKGKKPVVFLVSQMTRYGGPGSMFNELLTRARLENAIGLAGVSNGQMISPEQIVKVDPDMFFVSTDRESDTTRASPLPRQFPCKPRHRADESGQAYRPGRRPLHLCRVPERRLCREGARECRLRPDFRHVRRKADPRLLMGL